MLSKCRICLKEGQNLIDLFEDENLNLSTQIMSIAKVQIHINDKLPKVICKKCVRKLKICIEFVTLCEKSDLELRYNLNIENKPVLSNKVSCCVYKKESDKFDNTNNFGTKVNVFQSKIDNRHRSRESQVYTGTERSDNYSNSIFKNEPNNLCNKCEFETTEDSKSIYEIEDFNETKNDLEASNVNIIKTKDINNENDQKSKNTTYNRKHQCPTCGKVTSSSFRLKTHLATHSKERPFSCKYCNKKFSINENLKVHLRTHTGEKPLQCTFCGEKFAHSAGLATHKRKHTGQKPYKCKICPQSFRTYSNMQYHVRLHADDKNFECGICNRAFISRSNLQLHLNTHSGEKPNICPLCKLGFSRISNLKRHLKVVHKKDNPKEFLHLSKIETSNEMK